MRPASLPALFNPDLLDDKSLIANFVARQDLLNFLVDELKSIPPQGTVQHRLLIGARGMGKTTLLRRIAAAIRQDAELSAKLIPLTFPEEQYNIKDLADFWLNTLDAVGDELERNGRQNEADELDQAVARMQGEDPARDTLARRAQVLLVERCALLGRRPVLLVDNIDFVFNRIDKSGRKSKNNDSSAYWELREALSRSDAPVLIGGSTRLSEPLIGDEKAFYNFFMVHRLGKLTFVEMCAILAHLADRHDAPRVHRVLVGEKARLRTLYDLTGGNVRTTLMLFHLLVQGVDGNVREDMERLLDNVTALYKARFEELADQTQVVCHALAMRWNPSSAAEVAEDSALDTRIVSAQLDNLFRDGIVEKVKLGRSRKTGYQIAERFFNLWLLMRTGRRMRHKLAYLTRFLESFYDADERRQLGEHQLNTAPSPERMLRHAELSWALANTVDDVELRRALEGQAGTLIFEHCQLVRKQVGELIGPGDFPAHQLTLLQCRQFIRNSAELLREAGIEPEKFELSSMGSVSLSLKEKQRVANWITTGPSTNKLIELAAVFNDEGIKWTEILKLLEGGLENLRRSIADGLIDLDNATLVDVKAATKRFKDTDIERIFGQLFFDNAVRCRHDADAAAWIEWGMLYYPQKTAYDWAEIAVKLQKKEFMLAAQAALDVARQLAGLDGRAWSHLAFLLKNDLNRYDEAEAAYRKAIELDGKSAYAWNGLGGLLQYHLNRYDEAGAAYRKAIELDEKYAHPWYGLGNLLQDHLSRYDEAAAAYRKAIELDEKAAYPWSGLGGLLQYHLNRYDEAEAAYRKAIALDEKYASPWIGLGNLLQDHLSRYVEAETAYHKALEIDPDNWAARTGVAVLCLQTGKLDEALRAIDQENDACMTNPLACGVIRTLVALQRENWFDARTEFEGLLGQFGERIPPAHWDDLLRILAWAIRYGAGEKMLALMREKNMHEQFWPLYAGFEAALADNVDWLLDVAPEVRMAARHIFDALQHQLGRPDAPEEE